MKKQEVGKRIVLAAVMLGLQLSFGGAVSRADELSELKEQMETTTKSLQQMQERMAQLEARQKLKERSYNEKIGQEVEKQVADAVKNGQTVTVPDSLKWAEKIKISGDLRYRHDHQDEEDGSNRGRWENGVDRERIRARLLFEAIVNNEWDVAFRIASGSDKSPISTNQDLEDGFSKKDIWLDLAYFNWHPSSVDGLNIAGGKMKNPFYKVGKNQLIWDSDLNPEGIAAQVHKPLRNGDELFANAGGFWVDESGSGADTSLWGAQAYIKHDIHNSDYLLGGASFLDYGNIEGRGDLKSTWSSSSSFFGNTSSGGVYRDDYNIFEAFGEYGFKCSGLPVAAFASWVRNLAATTSEDTGWLVGAKLNKAKDPGSWEFSYDYRVLDADAVVGGFTESDFVDSNTNSRGHKFGFKYQLAKNLQASLDYYHAQNTAGSRNLDYRRLLADLVLKF